MSPCKYGTELPGFISHGVTIVCLYFEMMLHYVFKISLFHNYVRNILKKSINGTYFLYILGYHVILVSYLSWARLKDSSIDYQM